MRVLLVHNVPIWHPHAGGGQRINHDIAVHLAERGHTVSVVHLGDKRGAPADLPYRAHHVAYTERPVVGALRVARGVRRVLDGDGVDVVYASAKEGGFLPRALPAGVGLLATHHHPDPPPLPDLDWVRRPVRSFRDARFYQGALLEAALLSGAHHATAPSRWSADRLEALGYVPEGRRVAVLRNGLREEWFAPLPAAEDVARTDLFFVGRLDEQKGLDVLLRALARPALAGRTLRVVGDGPDRGTLEALADDLGVADRVRFEGVAPNARVRALIGRSDVVVLPSRSENYPVVVLEALAARRPVVTTPVGGIPEMVDDGRHALLVPPGAVEELVQATARLLGDADLRRALVEAGRARAEEHRWARIMPSVEAALDETIRRARSGAGRPV